MNIITSLHRCYIQAVSRPARMTSWQRLAYATFLGAVTYGVTFGTAFAFDASVDMRAKISTTAALVVLVATPCLIPREPSPQARFLALNAFREQAGIDYREREEVNTKLSNECKDSYINLLRQQINDPLQEDRGNTFLTTDETGRLTALTVPPREALQKTLDDLTAS